MAMHSGTFLLVGMGCMGSKCRTQSLHAEIPLLSSSNGGGDLDLLGIWWTAERVRMVPLRCVANGCCADLKCIGC